MSGWLGSGIRLSVLIFQWTGGALGMAVGIRGAMKVNPSIPVRFGGSDAVPLQIGLATCDYMYQHFNVSSRVYLILCTHK